MPKNYVDNAMNRSLGRVGMERGSMPVSRGSSYGNGGGGGGGYSSSNRTDSGYSSSNSSSSSKTYVDNAMNRSIGRVGMPLGSMPVSTKSNSSVDCDRNTSLNANPSSYSTEDTYVDNAFNRKHERVGLSKGSAVLSRSGTDTKEKTKDQAPDTRTYADNALNRKHERVGLPVGSKVISKKSGTETFKVYKDNAMNRRLGRVGKPLGSMRIGKTSSTTKRTRGMIEEVDREELQERGDDSSGEDYYVNEQALCYLNRLHEEMMWKMLTSSEKQPETTTLVLEEYKGKTIAFGELKLRSKIGSGGFGDVYFAEWKGSVVAVKKLKAGTVSKRRLDDFVQEMKLFCELEHANIVKFIGACVERPDLCIVMEYMQMSLFDAIHIREDTDFTEVQRLGIIKQTCNGLKYLHKEDIAHRDLKTSNVLINNKEGMIEVKITDFGLSSMKSNIESSSSYRGEIIGTPRYSAPEILCGKRGLAVEDYKKADIYSVSLVLFEVVFGDEPFYNFDMHQLVKNVGNDGVAPEVPDRPVAVGHVLGVIKKAWSFKAEDRPKIADVCEVFEKQKTLYAA